MDVGILFTAAGTVVAIVGSNIALISWLRSDMKSFETDIRSDMKDFKNEIRGWKEDFRKDMASYKDEVKNEMKDFHGRLCTIEERSKIHKEKECLQDCY